MSSVFDIIKNLNKELTESGWNTQNNIGRNYNNTALFEVEVNINLRADCVLYINDKAIAIVEVKQNNYPNNIANALKQAEKYAYNYNTIYPAAWSKPLPFIFAYNGERIVFRDLKDRNSKPKEIKKFYSADELKKMLYTIPYSPTNVTNNIDIFLKYLKFAIILIYANSSDLAIQKYFESRFSESKFYVIGKKEYGIKRVLQFAYYLFTNVYLLDTQNDIFNINNKLLKDINDLSNVNIKINLNKNPENLINIPQSERIIKESPDKIIINYAEGFVRDTESYAIPIYEKFQNSEEQYIKFGVKNNEKEDSNFIYKFIQKLESDKPTLIDYLNRETDAVRLASFIANKKTQTPFNLAIISSWGNGKSSFINFMVKHLNIINKSLSGKNKHSDNTEYKKMNIIKFNAWQYNNNEQIGYALLDSIYSKLNLWDKIIQQLKKIFSIENFIGGILLFISVYTLCCFFQSKTLLNNILFNKENINLFIKALTLLVGGGMIAFIFNTFRYITNTIGEIFSFKYSKIYKENIDIKYEIKDYICNYIRILNKNEKRTIIFIDDLDRCSQQSIINLLDTLIIYFADDCDIVVVLNIDISIILNAITVKLENSNDIKKETQAIKYLDKIIQANYNIPKILPDEYGNIISKLVPIPNQPTSISVIDNNADSNNKNLTIEKEENIEQDKDKNDSQTIPSTIIQELPIDITEELKLFLQEYGELFEYSPRKIKRVINILKLLVNDLTYNNIEYNPKNLVAGICILESYPELSFYINKQFNDGSDFNISDTDLQKITQNNNKIIDLLLKNLSSIDKTQYYYIRKYIYDLPTVIINN